MSGPPDDSSSHSISSEAKEDEPLPNPAPAGFGNCPRCPYAQTGSAAICYECATATFERLAANRCDLCELPLRADGTCGNPVCSWDEDDRGFRWVWAMSMRTGSLRLAIDRYKVQGKTGWAWIFGRVLVGYLNAGQAAFGQYDAIIPSPTYVGEGGRSFDHIGHIIERAVIEDDGTWPFEFGVIEKTRPTTRFRGQTWRRRFDIANQELEPALRVARPDVVKGKRILVLDDVYTEGLTIRCVARSLRTAGALEVSEIVLARQPYGGVG
jgi:predicted amidophosphoribosyltransferase